MLPLPMQFGCRELPLPLKHRSAVAGLLRYKQTILAIAIHNLVKTRRNTIHLLDLLPLAT